MNANATVLPPQILQILQGCGSRPMRDVTAREILGALATHGVLVLRNFIVTPADPQALTERFGRIVKTVEVTGTKYVGYHGELMYTPFPPDLLCFYCVSNSTEGGGETVFCDGTAVLQALSRSLVRHLETQRLCMRSSWSTGFLRRRFQVETDAQLRVRLAAIDGLDWHERSEIEWELTWRTSAIVNTRFQPSRAFVNSLVIALHDQRPRPERAYTLTMEDGSEFPKSALEEILAVTQRLTCPHAWQPGDYVVVDNSRMLHGRNPCLAEDTRERKLVNMHTLLRSDYKEIV